MLEKFRSCSGLELNKSKKEAMWLGSRAGRKERVAKGLCVTRDERQNLYVTRESYLKRNVIREYLNACDA